MKKWIFILLATSGFTALPPLAQNMRELKALLADEHLYEMLGSPEMIQAIVRNDEGYLLTTPHYTLQVNVHYLPAESGLIGPVRFQLEFQPPVDKITGQPKSASVVIY